MLCNKLPQNLEAEMSILGSCFLSTSALDKVCDSVTGDMFFSDANKKIFEAHRKYIDLHYIIDGVEQFGYANIDTLTPAGEYNEADDYILLCGEVNRITLSNGDFVIAFPEDAHIPALKYKNSEKVKRAVVKIPV